MSWTLGFGLASTEQHGTMQHSVFLAIGILPVWMVLGSSLFFHPFFLCGLAIVLDLCPQPLWHAVPLRFPNQVSSLSSPPLSKKACILLPLVMWWLFKAIFALACSQASLSIYPPKSQGNTGGKERGKKRVSVIAQAGGGSPPCLPSSALHFVTGPGKSGEEGSRHLIAPCHRTMAARHIQDS